MLKIFTKTIANIQDNDARCATYVFWFGILLIANQYIVV